MLKWLLAAAVVVLAAYAWVSQTESGQDFALPRLLAAAIGPVEVPDEAVLEVLVCGSSSPIRAPGRAQACVAVRAGQRLLLIDAGAGSAQVLAQSGLALERIEGIFLTHFHSDHIADIPDVNLNSWVAGRPAPLAVSGPVGVERVVAGLNEAYALDRSYRSAHHGDSLMPPALGVLESRVMEPGRLDLGDGLTVTAAEVNHDPIRPAFAYRIDYRGRSVVISGDTVVVENLIELAQGADLLLHDALSLPLILAMSARMGEVGRERMQQILMDVTDYHAHVDQLGEVAEQAQVGQLALYHLVPSPPNALLESIFRRGLPREAVVTEDGSRFELPLGSEQIHIVEP